MVRIWLTWTRSVSSEMWCVFLGGEGNIAGDPERLDHAIGRQSAVSGGKDNLATGNHSTVGGGQENIACSPSQSVAYSLGPDLCETRFVDNGYGTIYDRQTNLLWQKATGSDDLD